MTGVGLFLYARFSLIGRSGAEMSGDWGGSAATLSVVRAGARRT